MNLTADEYELEIIFRPKTWGVVDDNDYVFALRESFPRHYLKDHDGFIDIIMEGLKHKLKRVFSENKENIFPKEVCGMRNLIYKMLLVDK